MTPARLCVRRQVKPIGKLNIGLNGCRFFDLLKLANVVDYGAVVDGIKDILAGGHLNLVETLADRIADFCLSDARVRVARVRIEKLKVVAEAKSVGVEIERESPH